MRSTQEHTRAHSHGCTLQWRQIDQHTEGSRAHAERTCSIYAYTGTGMDTDMDVDTDSDTDNRHTQTVER